MADFRHPNRALIWRSLPADQLIFQMDFNHFTHQAIRRAAHGGNLLQNRQTRFARLKRPLQRFYLPAYATNTGKDTFLSSGECGIRPPYTIGGILSEFYVYVIVKLHTI